MQFEGSAVSSLDLPLTIHLDVRASLHSYRVRPISLSDYRSKTSEPLTTGGMRPGMANQASLWVGASAPT
jgi:hypothetical protein